MQSFIRVLTLSFLIIIYLATGKDVSKYSTAQNYKNKQNFFLASFAHSFALLIWTYENIFIQMCYI